MYKIYTQKMGALWGCVCKMLLIMKLAAFLLVASMMQLHAASFAQKISLSVKNEALSKVFIKVSKQSGYDFLVSGSILKKQVLLRLM